MAGHTPKIKIFRKAIVMDKRVYGETHVMLSCAGSKADRKRWKKQALEADMTFEEYVRLKMEANSSGCHVHPAGHTPTDKPNQPTGGAR